MKLTLLGTGLELEVPMPLEKKGRDRLVQAFEREAERREAGDTTPKTQRRHGTFLSQLSATPAALPCDAVEVGRKSTEIRREIMRKACERWTEDQKRRPGGRTTGEWAKFYADIASELAAAGVEN